MEVSTGEVVLTLYGTGWRARAGEARVTIGGVNAPVVFSGAQAEFLGLDQINVGVPRELAGRGDVVSVITVSGREANPVRMTVR